MRGEERRRKMFFISMGARQAVRKNGGTDGVSVLAGRSLQGADEGGRYKR